MPDQNNSNTPNPAPGGAPAAPFSPFPADTSIPPVPAGLSEPPAPTPPPGPTGTAAPPLDIPPVVTPPSGGKKGVSGRVVATILGLLLLVGGIGAGIVLVGQQQLFQQKAAGGAVCAGGQTCRQGSCTTGETSTGGSCKTSHGETGVCCKPSATLPQPECVKQGNTCVARPEVCGTTVLNLACDTPAQACCAKGSSGGTVNECQSKGGTCKVITVGCASTETQSGTCPGQNDNRGGIATYLCCVPKTAPNPLPKSACASGQTCRQAACASGETAAGGSCTTSHGETGLCCAPATVPPCPTGQTCRQAACAVGETATRSCVTSHGETGVCCQSGGGGAPPAGPSTPTPTPPPGGGGGPTAQCLNIQAFDTNWTQLSGSQLAALKPGDKVRFTVAGQTSSGSFDRARFIINGVTRPEVTGKRPTTQEFFDEYTIPDGISTFSINANLHHDTLGWF